VVAFSESSVFIKGDGSAVAAGMSWKGLLSEATQIFTDVHSLAIGDSYCLFVKSDGTAWAVGSNKYGQLGDGFTVYQETPVLVLSDVQSVAAGNSHSFFPEKRQHALGCR